MKTVEIKNGPAGKGYPVWIGDGIFESRVEHIVAGRIKFGDDPGKIVVFSNETVFTLYGELLTKTIENTGIDLNCWLMPDGEENKNMQQLEAALKFLSAKEISRTDTIVSLGGGVVSDLAGLAASLYMRGIGYFQVPTTLLSMVDASVGGKTAVNLPAGKNLVGTFYHPLAVIADVAFLETLDLREVRAGFYELIKHGAIGGRGLLEQTRDMLSMFPPERFKDHFSRQAFRDSLTDLVTAQIEQKAKVVANDAVEDPLRNDAESRKILNFGHTVAHALEKTTDYRYFRHGEAVAFGMLTALQIAERLDICEENSINLLNDVVRSVGGLPDASGIDIDSVCNALALDKKRSQGSLQWVLLERIGSPRILSGNEIPDSIVRESLSTILSV